LVGNNQKGAAISVVLMVLLTATLLVTVLFQLREKESPWLREYRKHQALLNAESLLQWKALALQSYGLDSFKQANQSFLQEINGTTQIDTLGSWIRIQAKSRIKIHEMNIEAWFAKPLDRLLWKPAIRLGDKSPLEYSAQIQGEIIQDSTTRSFKSLNETLKNFVLEQFTEANSYYDNQASLPEKEDLYETLTGSYTFDPEELSQRKNHVFSVGGNITLRNLNSAVGKTPKDFKLLVEGDLIIDGPWNIEGASIWVKGQVKIEGKITGKKNTILAYKGFHWKGEGQLETNLWTQGLLLEDKAHLAGNSLIGVMGSGQEAIADGEIQIRNAAKVSGWLLSFVSSPRPEFINITTEPNTITKGILWSTGSLYLDGVHQGSVGANKLKCNSESLHCLAGGKILPREIPKHIFTPLFLNLSSNRPWVYFDWRIL
jgi:hypothetical protein